MTKEGNFRVEKFNGQKYHLWKMKMEDYLYQKYLLLSLGEKRKQPTTMKDEEWGVLDKKELEIIRLCLASSGDFNIKLLSSYIKKQHSVISSFCAEKGRVGEQSS